MRSTLFLIPFEAGGVPIFGLGVLLAVWAIACLVLFAWLVRQQGLGRHVAEYVPVMIFLGAAIFFLPRVFADYGGMPVRGYGVMVVLGATSGIALAAGRARRMGLNPDAIVSVCFWIIIAGIVGARVFYVVQYWERDFSGSTVFETAKRVANYTYGGLVIYGAILAGAAAFLWYTYRNKLPTLAMADLIAPGVVIGIAFGRIGCFLHGCCYGGICELPWAMTFPEGSPAYERQVAAGQIEIVNGAVPSRSRPIHPTQLYSAAHVGALALFLWTFYPYRRRDGQVLALLMLLYPVGRFLLEAVRTDEAGRFGTSLTISQWISIIIFAGGVALWGYLRTQRARTALPPSTQAVVAA